MKHWMINHFIIASALVFLVAHSDAKDMDASLPQTKDFALLALQSNQQKLPILIMYAAQTCEYCERLEEEILAPMYRSGHFNNRVIVRKVMIDTIENIRDFNGNIVHADNFAFKRGVQVTPTLQFVDANGNQLAPEMIGYNTPEFYANYIEDAIDTSQDAINSTKSEN
ncbi:MAG: thioredoxin fold domain-containing protein [Gammaproteobacteria bacterium]|nr:thioredoxin fold domain-containing protein [Gammaproteobacteria bacterium]